MSKALKRLALALLTASLCARAAAAQDSPTQPPTPAPTPEWVTVSPAGEQFTALVPKEPLWLEQEVRAEELAAAGRRYTAAAGGARYVVWALKDTQDTGGRLRTRSYEGWAFGGESRYLDLIAEAAWELLVKPEFERLVAEKRPPGEPGNFYPGMSLRREFELGGRAAREYAVALEREGGPVYVCSGGGHIYVVAALAPDRGAADSKRFVESFSLKGLPPEPGAAQAPVSGASPLPRRGVAPIDGGPLPPADAGTPVDYDRPFRQAEVTRKARITYKPEPGFTEWARRFNVSGVVRLRAILSKTGEVTDFTVAKYLPHGLTEKALNAARQVRFEPAEKDGRTVSQYVIFEYNYNIY
jgi:TonB family protein